MLHTVHPRLSSFSVHCRESPSSAFYCPENTAWDARMTGRFQRKECVGPWNTFCCPPDVGSTVARVLAEEAEAPKHSPRPGQPSLRVVGKPIRSQKAAVQPAGRPIRPSPKQSLFTLNASHPHNSDKIYHQKLVTQTRTLTNFPNISLCFQG